MPTDDVFVELARYYDPIMSHVDYERWYTVATALTALLPPTFRHLDAACGTGNLLKRLRKTGWNSVGVDLSAAMIQAGRRAALPPVAAVGDLRALPFRASLDYITCLFDSLNFMLEEADLRRALRELAGALADPGLLYFDVVTERMITDHFDGQKWTEKNGRFSTTWSSRYDAQAATAVTRIQVSKGPGNDIRERIYPPDVIEQALRDAGLTILGAFDADTWKAARRKSTRIDYIACKGDPAPFQRPLKAVTRDLRNQFA